MKKVFLVLMLVLGVSSMAFATSMIPKEVVIDATKDGQEMNLFLGQVLSIKLAENPTTGYRWSVEDFKPNILEQLEAVYKGNSGTIGAGGEKIFGFLAKKVGETPLKLEYNRPWEEASHPAKTFSIKIKVIKAGTPQSTEIFPAGSVKPGLEMGVGTSQEAIAPSLSQAKVSRSGNLMGVGIKLAELAKALETLTGPAFDYVSVVEFRGMGDAKEYVGLIINSSGSNPRCPNDKLPVNNRALKGIVSNLLSHYGEKATGMELAFFIGGLPQPGYTQVTLVGTGLGLFFDVNNGQPMGKLTGKL
ncbi:MAG: protease inhibitor I42 family protein [Candidatus Ozemobacteraceae bacterium]